MLLCFAVCLSPSLWWAYYVSFSGFFLCVLIGSIVFIFESGILNDGLKVTGECSLIRLNRNGEWSFSSVKEFETSVLLSGRLKIGSLLFLKFTLKRLDNATPASWKILRSNSFILLVRKQPLTEHAFHRLALYLS